MHGKYNLFFMKQNDGMKLFPKNIDLTKINVFLKKEKEEIMNLLGHGFNYWHADIWSYDIPKKKWEKQRCLVFVFENNIVNQVYIKKYYFWDSGV